ncbi:peptidase M20/M25/M40 family protein [Blastomonas sp. RAC04]|uniref:M20/M25/M40 family metallo-hydrolase n=1 Tax=Blastomonas sp. RAC04 TaxID=1842535 RepID=UPI00083E4FBA|nr:M20/M25/M40 family metallo-hydrolase [Blastomonas sp. RAC04]AOF99413.1 peptidase M20/M25/M40 family protein [Blastomonas sp. RAC04]
MHKITTLVAALALFTVPAHAEVEADPARLRADIEKLVSFGTRHTLSSPDHPTRGIGAARRWAAAEFAKIGKACGGCITIEQLDRRFTGPRAPNGVNVVNVLGVQQGSGDPDDVIIISAHIDSRVSDIADFTSDAPGANDDGSGVALVLEAARVLSKQKFAPTIIYAVLSGEEQGLWGGRLIAETARARGWRVRALLNNDIVGNTEGQDGRKVSDRVRVFSEGIRASESMTEAMARRGSGGEDDGPSRALMRAAQRVGKARGDLGLEVFGVRRPDRFSRGGDHLPALELGYPAIRFTVGVENYDHQHQDIRLEGDRKFGDTIDEMDFPYLARVTALNVAVIRELASAPAAPASAMLGGALSSDTQVSWAEVPGAARYKVYWRRADARDWEQSAETTDFKMTLPGVIVDDHFAGVAAISQSGAESAITFAGLPPR